MRDGSMRNLIKLAHRVAASDVPVLISGETGSGKEVLARFIHEVSSRAGSPFVKVNCPTLPPALVESELFGHEKGAFTGADGRRTGYFESAQKGTIVLDEVTELPVSIQVKLLRFLDDYRITRVGRTDEIQVDARVIALTNRDVEEEVRGGRFRQDLYYRLSTFVMLVPPLRSRPDDVPVLAEFFVRRTSLRLRVEPPSLDPGFLERLLAHQWPGNVRELRNVVEAAFIRSEGGVILAEHLPDGFGAGGRWSGAPGSPGPLVQSSIRHRREETEEDAIRHALAATDGNQTAAARILGISRRTIWEKIKRYGIR